MLMVQAFPANSDPLNLKLHHCEREHVSACYEFINSFFALPRR
jgi:hypothetical protein